MKHGIKGNNTGKADGDTNVVLGQGQIDIAGIVAEAKKIGIKYMFIEDESSTSTIQIPKSLLFLESLESYFGLGMHMNIQDFNITILGNTPKTIIQIVIFINGLPCVDNIIVGSVF